MAKSKSKSKSKNKKNTPNIVQVDIVSDIVCPWCWLGARYFLQAAKTSGKNVQLTWRPYMLDPNVPEEGVPYKDYMKAKFGDQPDNRWSAMKAHLLAAAPEAGITFRFGEMPMRPNTLRAHKVMRWAGGQGMGTEMAERLFKAFFDELKDVGDIAILSELAGDVGMDAALVAELLQSDKDEADVKQEMAYFQGLGVSSVPCFIYQGQFAVQGAQPAETHLAAIEKASKLPV